MTELFAEQIWWYIARAGGIVALGLTGVSVLWGLLLTTRFLGSTPRPKWLLDLHKFLGGLSILFTLIHVVALIADSFVSFGIVDVLIPFASSWKPSAVAWGVLSFWLLVAVQGSSLMMRKLPRSWWRGVHMGSYVALWAGTMHGITAGTDASSLPILLGVGGLTGLITFLTGWRILVPKSRATPRDKKPRRVEPNLRSG